MIQRYLRSGAILTLCVLACVLLIAVLNHGWKRDVQIDMESFKSSKIVPTHAGTTDSSYTVPSNGSSELEPIESRLQMRLSRVR